LNLVQEGQSAKTRFVFGAKLPLAHGRRITRLFRIATIGAGASFQLDTKFLVFAEFFMPLAA